jgi:nucleoside-diphosphate-sugar epimerase
MLKDFNEVLLPKVLVFGADGQDGRILNDIYKLHNQVDRIILIGRKQHQITVDQLSAILEQQHIDAIIYLAAVNLNYFEKEVNSIPEEIYWRINYQDPCFIFDIIRNTSIKFIYASTCQIYTPSNGFLKETSSKHAENIYQKTKLEAVNFLLANQDQVDVLIPHFYNHISTYSRPTILFNRLRRSFISDNLLRDFSVGSLNIWLDIGSAVEYMEALLNCIVSNLTGEINFCTSEPINMAKELNLIFNKEIFYNTHIEHSLPGYYGCNEKLVNLLDWDFTTTGRSLLYDWINVSEF